MLNEIHIVFTIDDDDAPEVVAAFTTPEKAQQYVGFEFDPELEEDAKPFIGSLPLDPEPRKREFVTIWHTCIDIQLGTFGEKGAASRHVSTDEFAVDREEITPTTYNLGYVNVFSRKSAADSIRRAKRFRNQALQKKNLSQ